MSFRKLKKRFLNNKKDETGAGLVSLIGVSMVVLVTAGVVTSAATFSTQKVNSSLSQQQASDYAQMGLNRAENYISRMIRGLDPNVLALKETVYDGEFSVQIYKSNKDELPNLEKVISKSDPSENKSISQKLAEVGIQAGNPSPTDKWVIAVSTGKGLHANTITLISAYEWRDTDVAVSPYTVAANNVILSGSTIGSSSGVTSRPVVFSDEGHIDCKKESIGVNQTVINGDIRKDKNTANTTASKIEGCKINGTVYTKEKLNVDKADITGVIMKSSNESNFITGLDPNGKAFETYVDTGLLNWKPTLYGYYPKLTENINPNPDELKVLPMTSEQCEKYNIFASLVNSLDRPTILDGRTCSNTNALYSGPDIKLKTDVAVIVDKAPSIRNAKISSADGKHHSLTIAARAGAESTNSVPVNSSGGGIMKASNVKTEPGASLMLYSSDQLSIENGSDFTGQAMAGTTLNMHNSSIHYHPVKLLGTTKVVSPKNGSAALVRVQ